MKSFEVKTDHIILNMQDDIINLDEYGCVIGISVEISDDSLDAAMDYNIGNQPLARINQGDDARQYGGFHVCEIPAHYSGTFEYKFTTNNGPRGMLILTKLTGAYKEVPEANDPS
jgi:hypothetical protein